MISKSYGGTDGSTAVADAQEDYAKQGDRELRRLHRRFFTADAALVRYKRKKKQENDAGGHMSASGDNVADSTTPKADGSAASGGNMRTTGKRKRTSASGDNAADSTDRFDKEAHDNYCRKVRILASDGGAAERRSLFLSAKVFFPNADVAIRDFAHAVRIATVKPMQLVSLYEDVYEELINKRHALIPDLKYSEKWKKLLAGIQADVLRMPGLMLPGCLQVVLRHLSFAKQRMDSCADPLAKLCLMLLPVALLLSAVACDERGQKEQRDRSAATLKKMTSQFLSAAGVAADWGLISVAFLRLFDCLDHDIGNSTDEVEKFCATMTACFVEGGVFKRLGAPAVSVAGGADQSPQLFITERVRMQTERKCVFRCGSQHQVVWGPMKEAELKELALCTRVAAQAAIARVRAEARGVRADFACFCLKFVDESLSGNSPHHRNLNDKLLGSARSLGEAFQLDSRVLELEYIDAMPVVARLYRSAKTAGEGEVAASGAEVSFDNRTVWNRLLDYKFLATEFLARLATFTVLPVMIRIYNSVLDGECQIERDIGMTNRFETEDDDLLDDLLVLTGHGGPRGPEDIAKRSSCGAMEATEFTERCVRKWRAFYGQRYGIDLSQRKRRVNQATSKHTFTNVRRAVLRAAQQTRKAHETGQLQDSRMTAYGVRNDFFKRPQFERKEKTGAWNTKLGKFTQKTFKTSVVKKVERYGRYSHPKWVAKRAHSDTFHNFDAGVVRRVAVWCAGSQSIKVAGGGGDHAGGQREHSCNSADILVLDSLEVLHASTLPENLLVGMVYVVFRGLPVTTTACIRRTEGLMVRLAKSEVMEHVPAKTQHVEIDFSISMKRKHPDVVQAVRNCCVMPGSNWRYGVTKESSRGEPDKKKGSASADHATNRKQTETGGSASGGQSSTTRGSASGNNATNRKQKLVRVQFDSLQGFWEWLQPLRRVLNSSHAPLLWRQNVPCPV